MLILRNTRPFIRYLLLLLLPTLLVGYAQDVPGFAEIRAPQPGDQLSGTVDVVGSADHPAFTGYELSFALDPNPTDTWFPLSERIDASVRDDRLARWDVSGLADGTYQLRLSVFVSSGAPLEAVVDGLVIGESSRAPTAAANAVATSARAAPLVESSAPEPAETNVDAPPETPEQLVTRLWRIGAGLAVAGLTSVAVYAWLRPRLRSYWGLLRRRRVARTDRPRERRS